MNNTIYILLPVYKGDNPIYFEQAVQSLLRQSYNNIKILIGVDGPIVSELAIVLNKIDQINTVQTVYFKENRGLACVLNDLIKIGLQQNGEYFARMDADDICTPDRLQKQYDFLQNNPEVDVVGGAIEEIDDNGIANGKRVVYPLTHYECRRFFRYRDPLAHPATFFRRSFFEKVEGYRPMYRKNQDTMLWFDGFMNGCTFANIPDTILYFRVAKDFYNRRNGWTRAKQMLQDRIQMNKALKYDISANIFAFAMFCMTISPTFIKKFLYKIR